MKRKYNMNVCKRILSIILCILITLNLSITKYTYVYADTVAPTENPLFIPITSLVTAVALGTGIVAKNSSEAITGANQLIQNAISNIKSSEIEKSEADASYDSPYRVINGGQPEKPNNSNKNGKWVALGAGSLASSEIWANKEAIISAMQEINKLNGYSKLLNQGGIKSVSDTNLLSTANASGIALQLAQYDSRLNTQFTAVLNSDVFNTWVESNNYNKDDLIYAIGFRPSDLALKSNLYPAITVSAIDSSKFTKIGLDYKLGFNNVSGAENSSRYAYSYSLYYLVDSPSYSSDSFWIYNVFNVLNDDNVAVNLNVGLFASSSRDANTDINVVQRTYNNITKFIAYNNKKVPQKEFAYVGYKWASDNPWQFTNNVYNVNQSFDVNFPDWLQESINLLGQQLDAIRLGITTIQPSWNPTQEQIQSGLSPQNVINQYINNYENPEYIPEDQPQGSEEPETQPVAPPIEEPAPTDDYLGNFLLPTSITEKFPFSIPFDIARCLELFDVNTRKAPKWEYDLRYGTQISHIVIDLSIFDDLASFIRPLEFIAFLVGLAYATRYLIRG